MRLWIRHALAAATASLVLSAAGDALSLEPTFRAQLACQAAQRAVLCVIELEPSLGAHITWADAQILAAPPFAKPVATKVTYHPDALKVGRMNLLLVPSGAGQGKLVVRVRGVVCADDGTSSCPGSSRVLEAPVRVAAAAR